MAQTDTHPPELAALTDDQLAALRAFAARVVREAHAEAERIDAQPLPFAMTAMSLAHAEALADVLGLGAGPLQIGFAAATAGQQLIDHTLALIQQRKEAPQQ